MDYLWKNVRTEGREEESFQRKGIPEEEIGCTKEKHKMKTMKQLFPEESVEEEITKIGKG